MKKVVVVGPSTAGKTTFFNKCTKPDFIFNEGHSPTEFLDEREVTVECGGRDISFKMVDTVGSAIFGECVTGSNIFRDVRFVLCLFDVSSRLSFEEFSRKKERLDNIKAEIELKRTDIHDVDFLMIGAKSDKEPKVSEHEVMNFVDSASTYLNEEKSKERIHFFRLERKYFTCSAKLGYGISSILNYIAELIANDPSMDPEVLLRKESTVVLVDDPAKHKKKKKDCCGGEHVQ